MTLLLLAGVFLWAPVATADHVEGDGTCGISLLSPSLDPPLPDLGAIVPLGASAENIECARTMTLRAWDWNRNNALDGADARVFDTSNDGHMGVNRVGLYFCPDEGSPVCEDHGSPTTTIGAMDVEVAEHNSPRTEGWCAVYENGVRINQCGQNKQLEPMTANYLGAGCIFACNNDKSIEGTFGGWAAVE